MSSNDSLTARLVSAASSAPTRRDRWGQSSRFTSSGGVELANRFARTANDYSTRFSSRPSHRVGKFARALQSSRSTIDPTYASLRSMLGREYSQMISLGAAPQVMSELASAGRWGTLDRLQGHLASLVDGSDRSSDPPPPYESVVASTSILSNARPSDVTSESTPLSSDSAPSSSNIASRQYSSSVPDGLIYTTRTSVPSSPLGRMSRCTSPSSGQTSLSTIPAGLIHPTRTSDLVPSSASTIRSRQSSRFSSLTSPSIPDGLIFTIRTTSDAPSNRTGSRAASPWRRYNAQNSSQSAMSSGSRSIYELGTESAATSNSTPVSTAASTQVTIEPSELYGSTVPERFELPGTPTLSTRSASLVSRSGQRRPQLFRWLRRDTGSSPKSSRSSRIKTRYGMARRTQSRWR